MNKIDHYGSFLIQNGIPLRNLSIEELALRRADAISAIALINNANAPILGGDVYFSKNHINKPAYANWYSEFRLGEDIRQFSNRSCLEALKFINAFPDSTEGETLFVLVVKA
jgi:hypothetical protein